MQGDTETPAHAVPESRQRHIRQSTTADWQAQCFTRGVYPIASEPRQGDAAGLHLYGELLDAVSRLQGLDSLETVWDGHLPEFREDAMNFQTLGDWPPSLTTLQIHAHPAGVTKFLASHTDLTNLGLADSKLLSQLDLPQFFVAVADSCPLILTLALNLFEDGADQDLDNSQSITMALIRPLLKCPRLEHLTVAHGFPMALGEQDLLDMGSAWRRINHLYLCADAYLRRTAMAERGTPLATLANIGSAFPALETFGAFFTKPPLPKEYDVHTRFDALNTLFVGVSPVPNDAVVETALFIARVCPNAEPRTSSIGWRSTVQQSDAAERGRSTGDGANGTEWEDCFRYSNAAEDRYSSRSIG